jgi:hypothetical protein
MFQVGKRVIALTNNPEIFWGKGQVFVLLGLKENFCKCSPLLLDIGIRIPTAHISYCPDCAIVDWTFDLIGWCISASFAPCDDSLSELTDHDIIYSEETEEVCVEISRENQKSSLQKNSH